MVLTESAGQTTITITTSYPSKAARDAALETGATSGMDQGFAKLDACCGPCSDRKKERSRRRVAASARAAGTKRNRDAMLRYGIIAAKGVRRLGGRH